jgi:hypothetical protein
MGHVLAPEPTSEAGAVWSRWTHVSVGPLLSGEAGLSAEGRMAATDPSWMMRQGPEPLGMWQRQNPPKRRGGVWSLGHMAVPEPSLRREEGSCATVARGSEWTHTLPLSCPKACMQGYPVYRISTVAPGPTLEEAVNPQVGPTSFSPRGFFETQS